MHLHTAAELIVERADAAASFNHEVLFILADNSVQELVVSRGYSSIVLSAVYYDLEEAESVGFIILEKNAGVQVAS